MKYLKYLSTSLLATTAILVTPLLGIEASLAQRVENVAPTPNSQNVPADTSISGVFNTNDGSKVDLNSVKIYLNNQDITRASTITPNFFSYRPPQNLRPGAHKIKLEFKNTAGQTWQVAWDFSVQQPQAALEITSVTHNASTQALGANSTFFATINGTSGGTGSVLLVENGQTVRQLAAQEVSPGVYVATLNLGARDNIKEGIVVGRLEKQGQKVYSAASQSVFFDPGVATTQVPQTTSPSTSTNAPNQTSVSTVPLKPEFTSHKENGTVNSGTGFNLTGKTQPGAMVKIEVVSSPPSLGGIISIGGVSNLLDTQVKADANGNFQVSVPRPPILQKGIVYAIRAIASNNNQTATTMLKLTQQ